MNAYVFPGQGSQFSGMGKDLFDSHPEAKALFEQANDILGFSLTNIMFEGSSEDLKETRVTQPAIFVHSVAVSRVLGGDFIPDMVAGHSLGEFSALAAIGVLSFEDGLRLVAQRAQAMQDACALEKGTMAWHGVLPWHPSKRDFYDQAAREFGLFPLSFSEVVGATNKIVTDDRIQNGLAYRFKEPQLGLKSWTE